MKKLFVLMSFIALGVGSVFAQKGEKAVGVNLGYGTEISNLGIGAKFQYGITDAIRTEASFNYFLKKDGANMWDVNVNAHYLFPIADKFKVYPLVGLTYANCKVDMGWSVEGMSPEDIQDLIDAGIIEDASEVTGETSSESEGRVGVNLGTGIQYDLSSKIAINFEVKYQLIKDFNQAVFGVGIAYKF